MTQEFEGALSKAMIIAGLIIIPPGLVLAGVFGGANGLAGGLAGFAVAVFHSVVLIAVLKWALRKPPEMLPSLLMASYVGRLLMLAVVLYGLHFIKALDTIALLLCFLALYLTHVGVEVFYAWKSLGFASGKKRD